MNYGVLMGYSAVHGSLDLGVCLPMYLSGVCWTLVYDTVYAHQDKRDDRTVGIKSTALLFGDRTKEILGGFTAAQMALLCLAGVEAGAGIPYYMGARRPTCRRSSSSPMQGNRRPLFPVTGVAGMGMHQAWQLTSVNLDDGPDCQRKFISNRDAGAIMFGGILVDKLMRLALAA